MQRDEQLIETELMEISAIQDDMTKLERIVTWCALYPAEIPLALKFLRLRMSSEITKASVSSDS